MNVAAVTRATNRTSNATRSRHGASGRITCVRGFELWRSVVFLRGFGPLMGEQALGEDVIRKAFVHRGQVVAFEVRQVEAGAPDHEVLAYRLSSDRAIDDDTEAALAEHIRAFLSAGEDMRPFQQRASEDPCFAPVAARLAGFHHVRFPTPFEAACWGTIHQRIHLAQARGMKEALCRRFGGVARVGGEELLAFPEASTLVAAGEQALRSTMRHERKAAVVFGVARAFAEVEDSFLRKAPVADVEAWLLRIHGVGPFASRFTLFRGIGRFGGQHVSPPLLAAAGRVYGQRLDTSALLRISNGYGAWAGHWALYLRTASFPGFA